MINAIKVAHCFLFVAAATSGGAARAQAPATARLAATIDLFGARIGMTHTELLSHIAPSALRGERCIRSATHDRRALYLTCGSHNLTVDFTTSGRAWQIRASYDFTATPIQVADARKALVARYGNPSGANDLSTLTWLPRGTSSGKAAVCTATTALLSGALEQRGCAGAPATPLPSIDAECLPIRTAISADRDGHHGVIVEEQDPRLRLAELALATQRLGRTTPA